MKSRKYFVANHPFPDFQYPRPKQGEWLAFTARAEQGGFWDVVASVASGNDGSENTFRILANATNCSSPDTDGLDGMGSGVDLLNGPHTFGYTGSWEAFSQAGAEGVWVPAGNHRILFCADSEAFNLDYLRFYTPTPTPAPTPVPTRSPTMAPVVPDATGGRFTWVYISVSARGISAMNLYVKILHIFVLSYVFLSPQLLVVFGQRVSSGEGDVRRWSNVKSEIIGG